MLGVRQCAVQAVCRLAVCSLGSVVLKVSRSGCACRPYRRGRHRRARHSDLDACKIETT